MKKLAMLVLGLMFSLYAFASSMPNPSVRTVYTGSNVTTTTALTLVTTMAHPCSSVSILDTSGSVMQLNILNPYGTTDSLIIPPGGGGFPVQITGSATVSLIALSATPTAGENEINFFW